MAVSDSISFMLILLRCLFSEYYIILCIIFPSFRLLPLTLLVFIHQEKPNTPKELLQLVGVTSLFVASKYEEMYATEIADFVFISDNAYTKKQIREMEVDILSTLRFNVSHPLPIHFLRRNSKAGQVSLLSKIFM